MKMRVATLLLGLLAIGQYSYADPRLSAGAPGVPSTLPMDTRCSLSLGGDVVDYGDQSRGQLQDALAGRNSVTFGKRELMLSVACPYTQNMRIALRGVRNERGSLRYGNGGSLTVRLFGAQMDGRRVLVASANPAGVPNGAATDSLLLRPGESFAPIVNGQLAQGKTLTVRLEVEPTLPEAEARVSIRQVYESNFRLELLD